jgi:hypothetical protein
MPVVFFVEHGYLLREMFVQRGWVSFIEQETGLRVLIVDAKEDGVVPKMGEALSQGSWPDLVVCCYPKAAQLQYPDLVFLTDPGYEGEVDLFYFPDRLLVMGALDHTSEKENDG